MISVIRMTPRCGPIRSRSLAVPSADRRGPPDRLAADAPVGLGHLAADRVSADRGRRDAQECGGAGPGSNPHGSHQPSSTTPELPPPLWRRPRRTCAFLRDDGSGAGSRLPEDCGRCRPDDDPHARPASVPWCCWPPSLAFGGAKPRLCAAAISTWRQESSGSVPHSWSGPRERSCSRRTSRKQGAAWSAFLPSSLRCASTCRSLPRRIQVRSSSQGEGRAVVPRVLQQDVCLAAGRHVGRSRRPALS
jgi:hypothetical protein